MRNSRTLRPQHASLAHRRQEGDDVQEWPTQETLLKYEWEAGFCGRLELEEASIRKCIPLCARRRGCILLMRHIPGGGVIKICTRNLSLVYRTFPAHPMTGATSTARPHTPSFSLAAVECKLVAGSILGASQFSGSRRNPPLFSQAHRRQCRHYNPVVCSLAGLAGLSTITGLSAKNREGWWENDFLPRTGTGSPEKFLS